MLPSLSAPNRVLTVVILYCIYISMVFLYIVMFMTISLLMVLLNPSFSWFFSLTYRKRSNLFTQRAGPAVSSFMSLFPAQKEVLQTPHLWLLGLLGWRRRKKPCRPSATHPQTIAMFFTFSFLRNLSPFSPQLCSPMHLLLSLFSLSS